MTFLGRHRREADVHFQSILTRALEEVDGYNYAPAALLPGRTLLYPLTLARLRGRSGRHEKTRHHRDLIPGRSSRYTDYANPAALCNISACIMRPEVQIKI